MPWRFGIAMAMLQIPRPLPQLQLTALCPSIFALISAIWKIDTYIHCSGKQQRGHSGYENDFILSISV